MKATPSRFGELPRCNSPAVRSARASRCGRPERQGGHGEGHSRRIPGRSGRRMEQHPGDGEWEAPARVPDAGRGGSAHHVKV